MDREIYRRILRARKDVSPQLALAVASHIGYVTDEQLDTIIDIIDTNLSINENLEIIDKIIGKRNYGTDYWQDTIDWEYFNVEWDYLLMYDTRRVGLPAAQRQLTDYL